MSAPGTPSDAVVDTDEQIALFDYPACHDTREQTKALDGELKWLRKRVAGNDIRIKRQMCERCPGGTTDLSGVRKEFGFDLIVCVHCWRPGDSFPLWGRLNVSVDVTTWRQVVLHLTEGDVTIDLEGEGTKEWPTWAMAWQATGAMELNGGGPGVGCLAAAIRAVLANRSGPDQGN